MDKQNLFEKFTRIGARAKLTDRPARRRWGVPAAVITLDIREDVRGEYFEVATRPGENPEVAVLDVQPGDRHLLLLVRDGGEKQKYLCGHDERHWFVAAIPESAPVGTVRQAKEALKPEEVQVAQGQVGLPARERNRRKNSAYKRQGEWFFLPLPDFRVDPALVLCNEPIQRGGGKPHLVDYCHRTGGELVHVCNRHPNGLTEKQYKTLLSQTPSAKGWGWQIMKRNPGVYVRGRVRHADHKTILLREWHRVLMNTESEARAMRNVVFLD